MKKNKELIIQDIDFQCLESLWRWKFLTTAAIQKSIYKDRSHNRCYRKLLHLGKNKLIASLSSWNGKASVWHLADAGYEVLKAKFGTDVIKNGFRSENNNHDFWVTAIHLGDWLAGVPENCDYFSEQQLRRLEAMEYPKWVPNTREHRPDGYWSIDLNQPNQNSLIALEVELSKKSPSWYNDIGSFYSNRIYIKQVIWVVKAKSDINYILKHLRGGSSTQAREHSFITLDQFIQSQWHSEILIGKDQGKKLNEILNSHSVPAPSEQTALGLLDLRKKPTESISQRIANRPDLGLSRQY